MTGRKDIPRFVCNSAINSSIFFPDPLILTRQFGLDVRMGFWERHQWTRNILVIRIPGCARSIIVEAIDSGKGLYISGTKRIGIGRNDT